MKTVFKITTLLLLLFICSFTFGQKQSEFLINIRLNDSLYSLHQQSAHAIKNQQPAFAGKGTSISESKEILPFLKGNLINSACIDTSAVFYLKKDSVTFYVGNYIKAADGNLLVTGLYNDYRNSPNVESGCLLKCDIYGNVIWTKLYDSVNRTQFGYISYYNILELQDGSVLLAGATYDLVTQNDNLILTKTDNVGNMLWSKVFRSRLWGYGHGSTDYFYVRQMAQDPASGDLFITGPNWTAGRNIIKIANSNGNLLWSKLYQPPFAGSFDNPFGLDVNGNELLSFGRFSNNTFVYVSMYRININSGDTIQTKFFKVADTPHIKLSLLGTEPLRKLNNGNYAVGGQQYGFMHYGNDTTQPLYHAAIAEFTPSLSFVKSYCFRNNIETFSFYNKTNIHPDGTGIFRLFKVLSGYTADNYYAHYNNGNIIKQRWRHISGQGFPSINQALQLPNGGELFIELTGDSISSTSSAGFTKLHLTDTSSACLGIDISQTFTQNINYQTVNAGLDSIGSNVFIQLPDKLFASQNGIFNQWLPGCQQTSYCDSLTLTASADTLCPGMPLLITTHKNLQCGSNVLFNYDTTYVQSFIKLNDSTYSITFNAAWQGFIRGTTAGCSMLTDSVFITVLQAASVVNLGPDTTICPGNTIILNAHSGFNSYLWQNGSTDSTFTVTQPGTYYVTVSNICGANSTDTVIVSPHPPIPFDLGPNLTICERDTISLTAPTGFFNYQWSPNYNISSLVSQTVKVYPSIDTVYKVRAELTPGCFAADSVHVFVSPLPFINMGSDSSFCSGDSLILNAGAGFNQYLWNTGATSQLIVAHTTGTYSVIGTSVNGCKAYDTLKVLQVFTNPVVQLGNDSVICVGTAKTLDAGIFQQYLWNTGSTARTILVNTTGSYSVLVTDNNNCKGQGFINIIKSVIPPSGFLPQDTLICSYSTLTISPNNTFTSYLWNTNSTSAALNISQPGLYWLQVKDRYNCIGKDSITIAPKDCLKGFYIPAAFTPNNDAKNDLFKPFIFGVVQQYEFIIFNRYGQTIFRSTDLSKGWNGYFRGVKQENGAYIWTCKYQLAGENITLKQGSVLIIR